MTTAIATTEKPESKLKKYTNEVIEKHADGIVEYMKRPDVYWLNDYALEHGLHREYFTWWSKSNEKFYHAYKIAKEIQESKLVKMGMGPDSNTAFVIFTLKNVAMWRDKQPDEVDINATNIQINVNYS